MDEESRSAGARLAWHRAQGTELNKPRSEARVIEDGRMDGWTDERTEGLGWTRMGSKGGKTRRARSAACATKQQPGGGRLEVVVVVVVVQSVS